MEENDFSNENLNSPETSVGDSTPTPQDSDVTLGGEAINASSSGEATISTTQGEPRKLKLNYKRTFFIAFAFFGILLMWQVYDSNCSKLLEQQFMIALHKKNPEDVQYLVGIMMALDNLAALIMMPIFGSLSDKTHTKIGKRMPYILIGTLVCAIAFPFVPLLFNANSLIGLILIMAVVVFFAMMYRNPAVAMMPDMTPKPLRSKANGIINIVGYIGGLVALLAGLIFVLTKYLLPGEVTYAVNEILPHSVTLVDPLKGLATDVTVMINGNPEILHAGETVIPEGVKITKDLILAANGINPYSIGTDVASISQAYENAIQSVSGFIPGICNNAADVGHWGNAWIAEGPFLIASIFMIASVAVLFFKVKENKVAEEVKEDMELGEQEAELVDKVDNTTGLTKTNKLMLMLILVAEFFWFMAENGIGTFLTNYSTNLFGAATSTPILLTILGGVGSVTGFIVAPIMAGKIGRKWTLFSGLGLTLFMYALWMIFSLTPMYTHATAVPWTMYVIWLIKGFGMSLVHVNSFPMVVELCTGDKIGKFTGYYYASSMAAQTATPVLLGLFLLNKNIHWNFLPIYATICMAISLVTFFFVPNVKIKKASLKKGLEALDAGD